MFDNTADKFRDELNPAKELFGAGNHSKVSCSELPMFFLFLSALCGVVSRSFGSLLL